MTLSNGESYPGEIVGTDLDTDTAVIRIQATGLHAAKLGNSSELQVGEEILRVGIQRLTGNAFLAFADADGDGTYDHPSRGGC